MGEDFKEVGNQMSREESFFFFIRQNLLHFVPVISVSPDTTLKERCLGKGK